jgi:hypothetical protein
MNRAGPTEDPAKFEAIELGVSMMALVDGDTDNGLAVAVGRQRIELTRAAVRAIAMREVSSFDHPRDVVHCGLLLILLSLALHCRRIWVLCLDRTARQPRSIRRISSKRRPRPQRAAAMLSYTTGELGSFGVPDGRRVRLAPLRLRRSAPPGAQIWRSMAAASCFSSRKVAASA